MTGVLDFSESSVPARSREAGGKGASLARMTVARAARCRPGSWSRPARWRRRCPTAATSCARSPGARTRTAAQELIRTVELDPALREAVLDAYAALGEGEVPVAVRSSACAEDSEAASFAGQQETYLHVRGPDDVRARIRDCWASFFSERALFYRAKKGSLDDLGMAVVVQRMVEAELAGVLFTCDPVAGRSDRMVVEAVLGLGEAVVSGQVTPDHYVLKRDGTRAQGAGPRAAVRDRVGARGRRAASASSARRRAARARSPTSCWRGWRGSATTSSSASAARRTSSGRVQDGEIFVLQARPVTA